MGGLDLSRSLSPRLSSSLSLLLHIKQISFMVIVQFRLHQRFPLQLIALHSPPSLFFIIGRWTQFKLNTLPTLIHHPLANKIIKLYSPHTQIHTHTHTQIHTLIHTHTYTHIYIYIYIYIYVYKIQQNIQHKIRMAITSSLVVPFLASLVLVTFAQRPEVVDPFPQPAPGHVAIGTGIIFQNVNFTAPINSDTLECLTTEMQKVDPNTNIILNNYTAFAPNSWSTFYVGYTGSGYQSDYTAAFSAYVSLRSSLGLFACIRSKAAPGQLAPNFNVFLGSPSRVIAATEPSGDQNIDAWIPAAVIGGLAVIGLAAVWIWWCTRKGQIYAPDDFPDKSGINNEK